MSELVTLDVQHSRVTSEGQERLRQKLSKLKDVYR
jgi:hypothetical protein